MHLQCSRVNLGGQNGPSDVLVVVYALALTNKLIDNPTNQPMILKLTSCMCSTNPSTGKNTNADLSDVLIVFYALVLSHEQPCVLCQRALRERPEFVETSCSQMKGIGCSQNREVQGIAEKNSAPYEREKGAQPQCVMTGGEQTLRRKPRRQDLPRSETALGGGGARAEGGGALVLSHEEPRVLCQRALRERHEFDETRRNESSYTDLYSVKYDSGSVQHQRIFSQPRTALRPLPARPVREVRVCYEREEFAETR